ncbi:protein rep, partial [Pseudomonas pseudonitroreducens]|uniref:protein rep n=1 Tax=Pseudomonas pseudonitroreducens TaxID=2892326 RepID=UPI001F1B1B6F
SAYLARWEAIQAERPDLRPYLITLTVKNGPDLGERHAHLTKALRRLMDRRRFFNAGKRGSPWTELCKVEGGVYTLELTNRGNGWHPHCHMIALAASAPSQSALSAEWLGVTGDSMIVDVRPITGDPSEGFMEVFKYAVKFSDLTLADNWHAAQTLKGKRLLNSFGLFRGVEIPESLLDEPLDELPYWDRFYRFMGGEYQFTGESPKERGR